MITSSQIGGAAREVLRELARLVVAGKCLGTVLYKVFAEELKKASR